MNQAYKLLKLNTGDDIVCKTEENLSLKDKESIFVQDPMVLNQIRVPYGSGVMESYTLSPWMAMTEDTFYEIKGYMNEISKIKLDLFKEKYPEHKICIIQGYEYNLLKEKYKSLIFWE